jgi:succinate dehydrogenase flavin-adding protein (antitoxin of CptAB toxin-antitoxin module)
MKELDILLERFIDHNHSILAEGDWPEFEALLKAEDDQLWDWVQDPTIPAAAPYRALLEAVRGGAA